MVDLAVSVKTRLLLSLGAKTKSQLHSESAFSSCLGYGIVVAGEGRRGDSDMAQE